LFKVDFAKTIAIYNIRHIDNDYTIYLAVCFKVTTV